MDERQERIYLVDAGGEFSRIKNKSEGEKNTSWFPRTQKLMSGTILGEPLERSEKEKEAITRGGGGQGMKKDYTLSILHRILDPLIFYTLICSSFFRYIIPSPHHLIHIFPEWKATRRTSLRDSLYQLDWIWPTLAKWVSAIIALQNNWKINPVGLKRWKKKLLRVEREFLICNESFVPFSYGGGEKG